MMNGLLDPLDMAVIRGDEGKIKKRIGRQARTFTCADCGLDMQASTPKMPYYGEGEQGILIVLDTPSQNEDEQGMPWSGPRGAALKELLKDRLNIRVKRDCWTTYAVRCCAHKNINGPQCEACRKYLHQDIEELNPQVIIPFGYWALMGVSGDILTDKSRGKSCDEWSGFQIPDQRFLKWICPVDDPYMFNLDTRFVDTVRIDRFITQILMAFSLVGTPVEKYNYKKRIETLTNSSDIINELSRLQDKSRSMGRIVLGLDYETTGRKPHREGHEVVSIAISDGNRAWAFDYDKADNVITILFRALLKSSKVHWIVHNVQFEWLWSFNIFGVWPTNLLHDTILGVHVLNSHKRVGLKPNVYSLFGVAGYDDGTEDYIAAPASEESQYGANGFNLMKQAPAQDRLFYNGMDALFTYRIAKYLEKNIRKENLVGYKFLMESAINLVKAQDNGLRVAGGGVDMARKELTIELDKLEGEINRLAIKGGWTKGLAFRPSAGDDISKYLFNIKGYEPDKKTAKGKPSTDKESLEKIKDPIITPILEWKKLQKLRDTYINGLIVEAVDGLIHPFFNLYTVVTFRSSSDCPNFQNFPKRDKKTSKIIRDLLFPHKGHKLVEYDYKAIEVCVSACYNKDSNLIKYVTDPSTDMHRDTGIEIFMYDDNPAGLSKFDRGIAKNKFVFPEFYGSYFEQTAPDLWNYCSPEARANLKGHGVRGFKDFREHIREIEKSFWEDRFPEYTQWKKDIYNRYLRKGYVDSYTGFRYYGPMRRNEVLNIAIQGSAHHVLLRTFNKVSQILMDKKMKSKMIGQIHDSMLPSVDPDEESYIDKIVWYYGTQEILDEWKWIIVPIAIEKAAGQIDRPWSELTELGLLGTNGKIQS